MTRIALVASSYLPRFGGVEEHVHHLAAELRDRGHDVFVWAVDQNDEVPAGETARYLPTPLPNRSPAGALGFLARFPAAAARWTRAARLDRPEIVDIQCFGSNGPYASALARRRGIPLVYSNHGETFMDAHGAFEGSALLRTSLRRTLEQAAQVTSCSRFAADDLRRFGAGPAPVVVANGIDLDLPAAPLPTPLPERYIAGVGRLVANKGFDALLRGFAEAAAHERLSGVDLVIAGDGPERLPLEQLARRLGVAARVHFPGALQRNQVRTLLDAATVHVVPSRVEAFGIVVLEGWRSGVPVVATAHGGPPEFVTDDVDGLLFDSGDVSALARILVDLVPDDARRARLGAAGRASARRFSWSAVADRYEDAFTTALSATPDRTRSRP